MKNRILLALVVLFVSSSALAAPMWFGGYNRDWNEPRNWNSNDPNQWAVPTILDKVKVDFVWTNPGPVVSTPGAIANSIYIAEGGPGLPGYQDLTVVTGGELTVNDRVLVGYYAVDEGGLVCDGGTINIGTHLFVGFDSSNPLTGGSGLLQINSGIVNVGAMFGVAFHGGGSDPNSVGHVQLNGGILHTEQWKMDPNNGTMDIAGGIWIQEHHWAPEIEALVAAGNITGFGGDGDVTVTWDPFASKTIVTAVLSLFEIDDITVTDFSPVINDPCQPGEFDIDNMFEIGPANDVNATIFMDANGGAGSVYYVEFETKALAQVENLYIKMAQDAEPNQFRAVSYVKVLAKSLNSSTYDVVLHERALPLHYGTIEIRADVQYPVVAQDYRLEFTGADNWGPRIREVNASGKYVESIGSTLQEVWVADKLKIIATTPTNFRVPEHCFEANGVDDLETIFHNGISNDANLMLSTNVYFIEWETDDVVQVESLAVKLSHDGFVEPNEPNRAVSHLTIRAKLFDSATYDTVLYDKAITVPYGPNTTTFTDSNTLASEVRAKFFRAEFTGHKVDSGPRIRELDAIGRIPESSISDYSGDCLVNFEDFATLAIQWQQDNTTITEQVVDDFESYSSLPNATWTIEYADGYSSMSLITDPCDAHGGSKALRWNYDVAADIGVHATGGIDMTLPAPIDLDDYSQIKLWLHRHTGNGPATRLELRFLDSADVVWASAISSVDDPNGAYDQWVVNMNELDSVLPLDIVSYLTDIAKINLHIEKALEIAGGVGTIDVDDIVLVLKCTDLVSDLNGDCKVNYDDLLILLPEWLNDGF